MKAQHRIFWKCFVSLSIVVPTVVGALFGLTVLTVFHPWIGLSILILGLCAGVAALIAYD